MKIGSLEIGPGKKPFIIAELGANHNGDMDLARKLIDQAKAAGADCIKFQSWTKESIFSKVVYEQNYFLSDDYRNRTDFTLEQIVDKYHMSAANLTDMKKYCEKVGILFASTPFAKAEVDHLCDKLNVDFIKIASMDCTNYPFLDYVARKGKPMILSTGFAKMSEISQAVETIEAAGNNQICLLHCVSNYPPKDSNINLRNMDTLAQTFQYPVGFSDHTMGTCIPLAAIARGACVIEKHFTLDKEMFGWDHKISADFQELKTVVEEGQRIAQALGSPRRIISTDDKERMPAYRRSIVTAKKIKKGQVISRDDLDFKRPGTGLVPGAIEWVIGKVAQRDLDADVVLSKEDF